MLYSALFLNLPSHFFRHILHMLVVMLFLVFFAATAFAVPKNPSKITFAHTETTHSIIAVHVGADALDQQPFQYIQNGRTQNGYYDASTNTFVGVGDRITTVIRPSNPENYLNNLRKRQ